MNQVADVVQNPAKQAGVEKRWSVTSHNWASSELRYCSHHTGCKSCGPWVAEETFQNFLEKTSAPQETVSPYQNEISGTNRPLLSESSFVWIFKGQEQQFSENAATALNDLFREIQDRKREKERWKSSLPFFSFSLWMPPRHCSVINAKRRWIEHYQVWNLSGDCKTIKLVVDVQFTKVQVSLKIS